MRIAAQDAPVEATADLRLSLADGPAEGDQVVDKQGAHVFLEPSAASYLDDKVLDADIDGHEVRFAVSERRQ